MRHIALGFYTFSAVACSANTIHGNTAWSLIWGTLAVGFYCLNLYANEEQFRREHGIT